MIDLTSGSMSKQEKCLYEFGPFCLDTNERVLLRDGCSIRFGRSLLISC